MAGEYQFPVDTWLYACVSGPSDGSPYPSGCAYYKVDGTVLNLEAAQATREQYNEIFGAVLFIIGLVIAFALIKKAIEQ